MNRKDIIIPFIAFVSVIALFLNGPIPQDQGYHSFIDRRHFLGIPNFVNVITNLPFLFFGLWGLQEGRNTNEKELKAITTLLFIGFILLTFGSGYYHWVPQNKSLVYDRIPMVIIFMSFFAFIIHNCIDRRTGFKAFILLNAFSFLYTDAPLFIRRLTSITISISAATIKRCLRE